MFCFLKGMTELQHSEKQMFGFQKNIDIQHMEILKTQIEKLFKDQMVWTFRIISNFKNEKYPI